MTLVAAAAALAGTGVGMVIAQDRPRAAPLAQPSTPPFRITAPGEPLPAIPPPPRERPTLTAPYAGDPGSIIERYRPVFHAMGYEIGFVRDGAVGEAVRYHWWAHKRFEQVVLLPSLDGGGFKTNPYGQPESEEAVAGLLERVKRAEGRK